MEQAVPGDQSRDSPSAQCTSAQRGPTGSSSREVPRPGFRLRAVGENQLARQENPRRGFQELSADQRRGADFGRHVPHPGRVFLGCRTKAQEAKKGLAPEGMGPAREVCILKLYRTASELIKRSVKKRFSLVRWASLHYTLVKISFKKQNLEK